MQHQGEAHQAQQQPAAEQQPAEHQHQHDQHQHQQQQQHEGAHHAEQQAPPPAPAPAPAWQSYSSVFTAAKAGMAGVDQQKVKQVVYEMSKNSAHFANEQRKQAQTDARIARLKAQAAQLTPAQLAAYQRSCDARISLLEAGRELGRVWLHVDMDSFYASVEERDQPGLKDKPMAVGGMGMICTANYRARAFGVRSAMPGFIAKKLCPQLVFVKPDFSKYTAASAEAFAVFRAFDERVHGAGLDEAYLDVTQHCTTHGVTGEQVAAELRAKVSEATRGLTCSVGIAPNMMLAKIASDRNKPNGQCVVGATREQVLAFIADLPVRKIPGIGKVMEQTLQALGVATCSDLITHAALLAALLSNISSSSLLEAGLGLGATQHSSRGGGPGSSEPGRKGISCERTFGAMSSAADMEQMAESLVQHLASDMASEGIEAKTLTLKLKTTAFEVRTRAVTLPTFVSSAAAMLPPILRLLRAELPVEIRLMGVRGSNLRKAPQSLGQLAAGGRKLNALERLVLQAKQQQEQQQGQHAPGSQTLEGQQDVQQQQQAVGATDVDGLHKQQRRQPWRLEAAAAAAGPQAHQQEQQQHEQDEDMPGLEWEGFAPCADDADEVLQPAWQTLPTQEELQAAYEQQCMQQQQQQAEQDAADLMDAAEAEGWEQQGHEGVWDLQPPQQQHWHPEPHQQPQQQQAGYQGVDPNEVLQQHQQHQQQQAHQVLCGWEPGDINCGGQGASLQPSKRQRRSFNPPPQSAQYVLAAAVPVAAQQQQLGCQQVAEQQPGQLDGPAAQHGSCWQKASALPQHDPHQHPRNAQQPLQQQQEHKQAVGSREHELQQQGPEPHQGAQPPAAAAAASTAAAAAAGTAAAAAAAGKAGAGGRRGGSAGVAACWTCLACTFSGNQHIWLRCSVCETPKGETQPPPLLPLSGNRPAAGAVGAAGGGGGRGGRSGRAGAGGRQLTLERLGLVPQKTPQGG